MQMEVYNPEHQFDEKQINDLKQPLQATRIKERRGGGGKMLKYLKTDDVIGVANSIFGYGCWGYKVVARDHQMVEDPKKGGAIHMYTADIELSVVGCPYSFPGDGVGIVNDPFTVEMHEKARKEATSDALKRALRHYGDQFGLCLYDPDDMVEAADGSAVSVKDVRVGQKSTQAKRVVDEQKPALSDDLKKRLNTLYPQAKALNLFPLGKSDTECVAAFLKFVSELVRTTIASPKDLTDAYLDKVEAHIKQVAAAAQQQPVTQVS